MPGRRATVVNEALWVPPSRGRHTTRWWGTPRGARRRSLTSLADPRMRSSRNAPPPTGPATAGVRRMTGRLPTSGSRRPQRRALPLVPPPPPAPVAPFPSLSGSPTVRRAVSVNPVDCCSLGCPRPPLSSTHFHHRQPRRYCRRHYRQQPLWSGGTVERRAGWRGGHVRPWRSGCGVAVRGHSGGWGAAAARVVA